MPTVMCITFCSYKRAGLSLGNKCMGWQKVDTTNYYPNEMLTERLAITSKAPYIGSVIVFCPQCTLLKGFPDNK